MRPEGSRAKLEDEGRSKGAERLLTGVVLSTIEKPF